jgi:hypothetical protein
MASPSTETHFHICSNMISYAEDIVETLRFYSAYLSIQDVETYTSVIEQLIRRATDHFAAVGTATDVPKHQLESWVEYLTFKMEALAQATAEYRAKVETGTVSGRMSAKDAGPANSPKNLP